MLTLPQVLASTQGPQVPDYIPIPARMSACLCPWCRMLIAHPPLAAMPTEPYLCLLDPPKRTHPVLCESCANVIAILYYYRADSRPAIYHRVFRGAKLAVYIELERLGATQTETVAVPVATLARTIGYSYEAVYKALHSLTKAGYIQDITLSNPRRHLYTVLIHQLPKGE